MIQVYFVSNVMTYLKTKNIKYRSAVKSNNEILMFVVAWMTLDEY
jgi:hypothetical protein